MLVRRLAPVAALIAVTAVWGWTFVIVRDAIASYPVLPFLALRFALAAVLLSPVLVRNGRGLRAGIVPGLALSAGYLAQTVGLRYTSPSKAGLLTGLFVVLTPVLAFIVTRSRPRLVTLICAGLALAGTALLVSPGGPQHGSQELFGDGLEVVTALCFSLHILLLAHYAPRNDPSRMALSQMMVAAVLFALGSAAGGGVPAVHPSVAVAIMITGALASALAFWIQTFVQQKISSSRTAIILASEPAFATFFGFALAGDRFSLLQASGAVFILGGIVYHELVAAPADLQSVAP